MPTKVKKKRASQQAALLGGPRYRWKSVREVEHGDQLVIAEQETLVLGVRQQEGSWWVSYSHPRTGTKTEEFYTASDYVYMRLPQEDT